MIENLDYNSSKELGMLSTPEEGFNISELMDFLDWKSYDNDIHIHRIDDYWYVDVGKKRLGVANELVYALYFAIKELKKEE